MMMYDTSYGHLHCCLLWGSSTTVRDESTVAVAFTTLPWGDATRAHRNKKYGTFDLWGKYRTLMRLGFD